LGKRLYHIMNNSITHKQNFFSYHVIYDDQNIPTIYT